MARARYIANEFSVAFAPWRVALTEHERALGRARLDLASRKTAYPVFRRPEWLKRVAIREGIWPCLDFCAGAARWFSLRCDFCVFWPDEQVD